MKELKTLKDIDFLLNEFNKREIKEVYKDEAEDFFGITEEDLK